MIIAEASDLDEALALALCLKREGRYNWFRGQIRSWPVVSSLLRFQDIQRAAAIKRVSRFMEWVNSTPGLEYLRANKHAAWAVAQHYGFPTNYVDFTLNPRKAAFFASQIEEPVNDACIICLSTQDLHEFWSSHSKLIANPDTEKISVEFVELHVPDLWRLQAQEGVFLFCPFDNFELLYDFDRIVFPLKTKAFPVPKECVYPNRKSRLEQLLDQFFDNERGAATRAELKSKINWIRVGVPPL